MLDLISQRLTKNAKKALKEVSHLSQEKDWRKIDSILLLKNILETKNSLGGIILKKFFQNKKNFPEKTDFSVFQVVSEALRIAAFNNNSYVGTEHLVNGFLVLQEKKRVKINPENQERLQILDQNSKKASFFPDFLISNANHSQPDFLQDLNSLISNFFSNQNDSNKNFNFLEKFCLDLNLQVKKNNYTLIGRKQEIDRISRILSRRNKNNPVLVGEPGVGKTAIVEGLAEKINQACAGHQLNEKKIFTLDMGLLLAGTNFRGEFESRLKEIINYAKKNTNIILFIDEIHTLVGAGNAIGGMDAANILKPALSRGEIQVIGATTFDEYHKYIKKDSALERRFQPIFVEEPTSEESLNILLGIKEHYEKHHHIKIADELIQEIVLLAKEYLPERFLPDSAIDLLDEASSLRASLLGQNNLYSKINQKKEELQKIIQQKEFLVIKEHYEEAIKARKKEKKIEQALKKMEEDLKIAEKKQTLQLQKEDVWQVLSQSAQIPIELLAKKNQDLPLFINSKLKENIVGQEEVIKKINQALIRQFSGFAHEKKPLGSFLFIGASGVGKTLTAKIIAQNLSPLGKENLIQINMSELTENHSVSRLLGAPAGYIGYEENGELAEKIRRNPYCVVLFDELEKAGPAVINLLLKILEEGKLTDSKGKNIDFRHSIIILTSNFATDELNKASQIGFSLEEKLSSKESFAQTKKTILKEVENFFPRELLDRLNHILVFNNLNKENLKEIAKKEIAKLQKHLQEKKIELLINENVFNWIAKKSHQPNQGARLVQRVIQDNLEPLIIDFISENQPLSTEKISCQFSLNKKNKLILKKIALSKKTSQN